jgi:hypothetical protein
MARELRFTDPAFRCAVVLSGTAMALYNAAHPQIEGLKGIESLDDRRWEKRQQQDYVLQYR